MEIMQKDALQEALRRVSRLWRRSVELSLNHLPLRRRPLVRLRRLFCKDRLSHNTFLSRLHHLPFSFPTRSSQSALHHFTSPLILLPPTEHLTHHHTTQSIRHNGQGQLLRRYASTNQHCISSLLGVARLHQEAIEESTRLRCTSRKGCDLPMTSDGVATSRLFSTSGRVFLKELY